MYKMVLSEDSVILNDQLLINLCDYAGPEGVQITCQLADDRCISFYIHCQVLELWTKSCESPRWIDTDIRPNVVQTFVYLLYHDKRKNIEELIENYMQFSQLCGLLQIPEAWKLLDTAYAFLRETIPLNIFHDLLRKPKSWIYNESVLKNLSVDNMKLIVKSNGLRLREVDVLCLCHRWANVSKTDNFSVVDRFNTVGRLIRFGLISPAEFSVLANETKDLVLYTLSRIDSVSLYQRTGTSTTPYISTPRIL